MTSVVHQPTMPRIATIYVKFIYADPLHFHEASHTNWIFYTNGEKPCETMQDPITENGLQYVWFTSL